jgi:hypothetical protein
VGEYYEFTPGGPLEGTVTFTVLGLDGGAFPRQDGWLFGLMGRAPGGAESNLQLHIYYNEGGNDAQIRFIAQRHDGTCAPKRFCERPDVKGDMAFDPGKAYTFNITWDNVSARMVMLDGPTKVAQWVTTTFGGYASIEWVRIGAAFPGKAGHMAPITVTAMEWSGNER